MLAVSETIAHLKVLTERGHLREQTIDTHTLYLPT